MFRFASKKNRQQVVKTIEKNTKDFFIMEEQYKHLYKYLAIGILFTGSVIANNYESFLKIFFLSNSKLRKRFDNLSGRSPLDPNIEVELPKEV